MSRSVGIVLAGAGSGSRLGLAVKKQFALLAGVPVLLRALRPLARLPGGAAAAVVLPPEDVERGSELLARELPELAARVVPGGATRQESVRLGLVALPQVDVVLIHDAARPLASRALALRTLEATTADESAVPVVGLSDTLRRRTESVNQSVSREGLFATQTPQGFPRDVLARAQERALADGVQATDDAGLCERYGHPVRLIEGEVTNVKITVAGDWEMAEALLQRRERGKEVRVAAVRTGIGYDVHRLEEGRACVLGGVRIESPRGPAGHSDGDVLVHAIMDALLGAAGEADIGCRFPPSDTRYAGADSVELLGQVRRVLGGRFRILFVDSILVAEAPRIAPHVPAMRRRIAGALGIPSERVNVKATTAEGIGGIGRGEGIAAQAVATLAEESP